MVTANNVYKRFECKSVMSDSYVEKYVRAKKRTAATPKKCLFGAPSQSETDEFMSREQAQEDEERESVLQKYDLDQVPAEFLEQSTTTQADEQADVAASTSSSSSAMAAISSATASEGFVFQPRIVSKRSPPPRQNLFSPIEKVRSSSSSSSSSFEDADIASTDYWQTSKRRRASSKEQVKRRTSVVPQAAETDKEKTNIQSDLPSSPK